MNPIEKGQSIQRLMPIQNTSIQDTITQGVNLSQSSLPTQNFELPVKGFIVPIEQRQAKLEGLFDDKTLKKAGVVECQTCANRVYQDESNDPGVSFKAPTHLSPTQSGGAVRAHEQEHVSNEQADARSEGREILSQSVQIFTATCPECGKSYVSGGVTKTTTAEKSNPYQKGNIPNSSGNLLDLKF